MPDTIMTRKTYIGISDGGFGLYPSPLIFPSPDLFPQTVTNIDTIVAGTQKLSKMLYDGDFKFGSMCADKFEVTLYDVDDLSGKYLYLYQIDNDGAYIALFSGIIESCKLDRLGDQRELVAYDLAYWSRNIDVAQWWETFWEGKTTATIHQLRNSLCAWMNFTFEDVELPNDNIQVSKDISLTSISFGDIISTICELNCCFPHFDENGMLRFIIINVEAEPYNLNDNLEGENCKFEEYVTIPMSGVTFYDSSDAVKQTVGDANNAYIVSKNFLLYSADGNKLSDVAATMLDYLNEFVYTPSELKLILSDYAVALGIYIETEKGNCYAMQLEYSGSMFVDETVKSPGKQKMGESMATTSLDSIILGEKIHRVTNEVDRFESEMVDVVEGIESSIEQTNKQIVLKIQSNTGDIVQVQLGVDSSQGSVFNVKAKNISMSAAEAINFMSNGNIDLTGKNITISSDNFSVDADGTISATNGSFTGSISGTTITGSTITGSSLATKSTSSYSKITIGDGRILFDNGSYIWGSVLGMLIAIQTRTLQITASNSVNINGEEVATQNMIPTSTLDLPASGNDNGISFSNASGWSKAARMGWVDDNYESKSSDKRIKFDISDIADISEIYMKLSPKKFKFRGKFDKVDDTTYRFGLIAQDVEKIFPQNKYNTVVTLNDADGAYADYVEGEYYGINYNDFHALHIQMIQSQQKRIEELEQKNAELEERIAKLESLIGGNNELE